MIYTQNGVRARSGGTRRARVIDEYLPTQLTEAEVVDVVDTAIAQVARGDSGNAQCAADGPGDEGRDRNRGGKADGRRLSERSRRGCSRFGSDRRVPDAMTRFGYTLMTERAT